MPYLGAKPDKGNFADLNGAKLIIDADADTSITADTDDTIDIEIAGADDFQFTANTFTVLSGSTLAIASGATIANSGTATGFSSADPSSADGDSLGTASAEWSDLYLADGGIIYFGNDQDVTVTHDPDDGLFLKSKATADDNPFLLTLQTGETDMAASDIIGALQFQAPDEGEGTDAILVSAAVKAYAEGDHSASSNATSLVATEKMTIKSDGKVGIGVTGSSIDELLHIFSSSNDSILKHESTGGQAMIDIGGNRTSDADIGHLRFHNAANGSLAQLRVERSGANNTGVMKIQVNAAGTMNEDVLILDSAGIVNLSESSNATMTTGMNINQAASDDEIFSLKSSDVAHGITSQLETDTFGAFRKMQAASGGVQLIGATEATQGCRLTAYVTTEDTAKSASAQNFISAYAVLKTGTSLDTVSGNTNVFGVIGTAGHTQFLVDSDGDIHYDGSTNAGAWDEYDDVSLLDTFRSLTITDKNAAKNIFGDFIDAHAKVLNDTGVITLNEDGHHFVSTKGLNGLLIDSIRQTNARMKTIVNAVEEMVPGFSQKLNQKLEAQELPALPV